MALVQDHSFPEHLYYDVPNQIWYAPLQDGTVRVGFTSWAAAFFGEVLVFTPKRIAHSFEKDRWLAMIEGGKWVGSARAAFEGVVVAHNETLVQHPELLVSDPFGEGWMLIVRPQHADWRSGLVTGADVGPQIERWIGTGAYKSRTG